MRQTYFDDPAWLRALTLTERAAFSKNGRHAKATKRFNQKLAEKRLQRWQEQPPFTDDSYFSQRLAAAQLTRDDFLRLLGEPIASISRRVASPPHWLAEVAAAFGGRAENPEAKVGEAVPSPMQPKGFGIAAVPLIERGRERLREGIKVLREQYRDLPFDPGTVEDLLLLNLPAQLVNMFSRTMVLELNVARLRGFLTGATSEERFQDFIRQLSQPDFTIPLLQEYPVLARLLTTAIDHWVRSSLEFLSHLCADWEIIRASLTPDCHPGTLVGISSGAGDNHREGRSVIIAFFESGFKVVYKPHSLSVDVHFNELLEWVNERGDHPPFRTTKVIDRGDYGWVDFVTAEGCSSPDEVRRFYERQGGYLALLYALEATDFHLENLIASGEHPVLIDLEALFHPRNESNAGSDESSLAGRTLMRHSVMRIGFLPQRFWANADSDGIEMSGLGGEAGQLSPHRELRWEKIATDEMYAVRKHVEIAGSQNRPKLDGAEIKAARYVEEIVAGFTSIYGLLMRHRDELLAEDGQLARFAEDKVRAVLRATRVYTLLLRESYHPDVLRDALDRDRLFDRLWVGTEKATFLSKVIPAEQADLRRGDIPVFSSRPGSRSVWTSIDEELADFFDEPSLDAVRRRILSMDVNDLNRQSWFIRASMTTLTMGLSFEDPDKYRMAEVPEVVTTREQLIAEACAIADRLEMLALRDGDYISWVGVTLVNERNWTLMPLSGELYGGTNGLALFLAYAGAITGEERYTKLAEEVVKSSRDLLKALREVRATKNTGFTATIGGYSGWGCLIYTFAHLSVLWNDPSLLTEAENVVETLSELIKDDKQLDMVDGTAGCIGALLTLYRCSSSERALAVAIQGGDHLIARAQPAGPGIAWLSELRAIRPLTGFSHGASGIAWALLELFDVTGEERFKRAALDAFAYERSVFLPELRNWPDYRDLDGLLEAGQKDDPEPSAMVTWCHGAPGIGLARVRALEILEDDEAIREDMNVALQTTLEQGFGRGHSLCHGDLGNLELLLQVSLKLNDPRWQAELGRTTSSIFSSMKKFGWLCGIPSGVETPGFMTGLAGIGYGLLRLAEPRRVPSVLLYEPPVKSALAKRSLS